MATTTTSEQLQAMLGNLLVTAEKSQQTGYQLLARRKAAKAVRRKAVAERLAASLEPDDPRLQLATLQAGKTSETAAALKQRITRLKKRPKVGENDWMVAGNVRFANGRAGGGLTVLVTQKETDRDGPLGKTTTDAFGDFFLLYDTCCVDDERGKKLPQVYVLIMDATGKVLAKSTAPLPVTAGKTHYVQVVIPREKI